MAVKKKDKLSDANIELNKSINEDREEYIRSLEASVQFLKNELDRANDRSKSNSGLPAGGSPIEKYTIDLIGSANEIELINKTHNLLSKFFSVVESNFYFKNQDGNLIPVSNTDTTAFLNKQTEHLEEQGILDWAFEEKAIKIIPNLEASSVKQSSYIIFPIFQHSDPIGVFIASTGLSHSSFDPKTLESLGNTLSIASILALNVLFFKDKEELKRKMDIINNQLMQNSLLLSVGDIAGTVSREMENPIRIIKANNDLIINGIGNTNRRAEIINTNLTRLDFLTSIIKKLAFEDDKEQSTVEMKSLINETLDILEFQISNEDIKIEKEFDDENLYVQCGKSQMQHVLLNLFLNARDAMPNGGLLSIGCFKQGDKKLSLSIADTGEGIPEGNIANIFEPHYSNKANSKKLALNLYMTKRIISRHKGKISFVSEQGKGTTFKIILPIIKK